MSEIEEINISINEAKNRVAIKNSLDRLTRDPNFERVILTGYFMEEASRLVLLKADPAMQSTESQLAITKCIDAIGHFRQYLRTTIQLGIMAEKSLAEDEQTREEIMQES